MREGWRDERRIERREKDGGMREGWKDERRMEG